MRTAPLKWDIFRHKAGRVFRSYGVTVPLGGARNQFTVPSNDTVNARQTHLAFLLLAADTQIQGCKRQQYSGHRLWMILTAVLLKIQVL